jgi:hypothetical protein
MGGTRYCAAVSTALLGAALLAAGCDGEHQGAREEHLVPDVACTFAPRMIAEIADARRTEAIGLHGGDVYFAIRGGGVRKLPKAGGPLVDVSDPPLSLVARANPGEVADDRYVYRLDQAALEIVRVEKGGSTRTFLAEVDSQSDSFAMILYGPWLYWTSSTGGLYKVPKAGGAAAVKLAGSGSYDDDDYRGLLAVDPDGVFFMAGLPGTRAHDADPLWLVHACR